jgi:hypothetical protein
VRVLLAELQSGRFQLTSYQVQLGFTSSHNMQQHSSFDNIFSTYGHTLVVDTEATATNISLGDYFKLYRSLEYYARHCYNIEDCMGKSFYAVSKSKLLTAIINFITMEFDNIN